MQVEIKLELMELMLYYWQTTADREKVGENYIIDIANQEDMEILYDDEFTKESVRKSLSSISNKEPFKPDNKKEGRFWNNNMWMLEDMDFMMMMYAPIKKMNLDELGEKIALDSKITVHFVPGHIDISKRVENDVYINFFRVKADLYEDDKLTIEDKSIPDYIASLF